MIKSGVRCKGEEWLSSAPKHVALYDMFGWSVPNFTHLPLLLNKDGAKLSKRHGDVAVQDFIDKGYLPSAVVNFVALLGWTPPVNPDEDDDGEGEGSRFADWVSGLCWLALPGVMLVCMAERFDAGRYC